MKRTLVESSSPFASIVGFSGPLRVGDITSVGGTAPIDSQGRTVGIDGAGAQARTGSFSVSPDRLEVQ